MTATAVTAAVLPWGLAALCRYVMTGLLGAGATLGFWQCLTASSAGCALYFVVTRPHLITLICAADFAIGVYFSHGRRGRRKRVLREAGARTRALAAIAADLISLIG